MKKWLALTTIAGGIAALLLVALPILTDRRAPTIPPYPNAADGFHPPSRLEEWLLGEAFGGFHTPDSEEAVRRYYATHLAEAGWHNGWYTNRAGRCYLLIIITNNPAIARPPTGMTSISFKLRERRASDTRTGCR